MDKLYEEITQYQMKIKKMEMKEFEGEIEAQKKRLKNIQVDIAKQKMMTLYQLKKIKEEKDVQTSQTSNKKSAMQFIDNSVIKQESANKEASCISR